jgi:hypothetical protein
MGVWAPDHEHGKAEEAHMNDLDIVMADADSIWDLLNRDELTSRSANRWVDAAVRVAALRPDIFKDMVRQWSGQDNPRYRSVFTDRYMVAEFQKIGVVFRAKPRRKGEWLCVKWKP